MKEIKTQQDYLKLIEELQEHDRHYYAEFKPVISDYDYDQLTKALEAFEKEHPDLISPESPSQRVGEALTEGFQKWEHAMPMLSLANTYSEEEVNDFVDRMYRLTERQDLLFCTELKMDGTAVSLRYEKGEFARALTRGNGRVGDDVTSNIRTIRNIPMKLHGKDYPEVLEVRGEVFMHKQTFQSLNEKRQEEGHELWANPRNAAAGSLKLLDPKEVARRKLDIVFYAVAEGTEPVPSQFETHLYLKKLGLPVSKESHFARCKNLNEIKAFDDKIEKEREKLSFEIDGIVIKVDDLKFHPKLGVTGKSPRYAVAYKFAPEQAVTIINDITVQVGRTGVLTPVAELEPVHLAGSTIARATLHNQDEIKRKDIRIGDTVVIEKGGDVIPKVVKVDFDKRPKNARQWNMPDSCPVCSTEVIHREGEVAVRCPNPKCGGQKIRRIIFFCSRAAMDIEHLGEKIVKLLVDRGFISRPSDIYLLSEEMLSELEGFKEKAIYNLLTSVEESKKRPLSRFIMGLGIPYVGAETADLLANYAQNINTFMTLKKEELIEIEGIGEKVAESIVEFVNDPNHQEEINLLLSHGVTPQKPSKKRITGHIFTGKIFVLTGTLENFTRQEATHLIKERGGKVTGSVSKKTDFVLAGEDPGSKYDKAKKLDISILSEKEFEKLL